MQEVSWNALWDTSWQELRAGKYSEEGACQFSTDRGAYLEIPFGNLSARNTQDIGNAFLQGNEGIHYDYLFGIAQDGTQLVLCNVLSRGVKQSIPGSTCEKLIAPTLLASKKEFDPRTPILSMRFELQLMRDWLGLKYNPKHKGTEYIFDMNTGKKSFPLFISNQMCAEIRVGISKPTHSISEIAFPYYCYIDIEYLRGKTLDEIWISDLWKLQSMFAFCFGKYPAILHAQVKQYKGSEWIQVYRRTVHVDENENLLANPPIPFSQLRRDGLLSMTERWFTLSPDCWNAAKILTSLLGHWTMPLDLMLTAATTMFESLIRADRDPLFKEEEFNQLTNPILNVAHDKIHQRLKGLLELLKKPSYHMLLKEAYTESQPWSDRLIPQWKRFQEEQYKLRLSGAHGLGTEETAQIRIYHYHAQIVLGYIILMKRLGLSDETINCFEKSSFLNIARQNISEYYSK